MKLSSAIAAPLSAGRPGGRAADPAVRVPGPCGRRLFVEAGLAFLDPFVVFLDELEGWIGDFFVIVPPLPHEAVRIIVHLAAFGDVVAFP